MSGDTRVLLFKAHVKGHYRDGKYVAPYETKAPNAKPRQKTLFGKVTSAIKGKKKSPNDFSAPSKYHDKHHYGGEHKGPSGQQSKPKPKPPEGYHPKRDDNGNRVGIKKLSTPKAGEAWHDAGESVTITPGHAVPKTLNGVAFKPWNDHPESLMGWDEVEGQDHHLDEPDFEVGEGKHPSAGVIVQEDDGRVWLMSPTNRFGGVDATFPKGTVDPGMGLQASAIKEAFEESGLKVEINGYVADVDRSTSTTRYYRARRVGGDPSDMGWEAQAVNLVPVDQLHEFLNSKYDKPLIEALKGNGRA